MPVDNATFCSVITPFQPPVCITLPGGGEICFQIPPGEIPTSGDVCGDLLGQLNTALAGLAPIMCLIDCALSVIAAVTAVPESLGPPPDPTVLVEAITDMVEKCACLLPLVPQLSICPMVKSILGLLVACLDDIIAQVTNAATLRTGVDASNAILDALDLANEVGLDLTQAREALVCEEANIDLLLDSLDSSTAGIQRLLDVTINPLMQLAGLDPIEFADIDFSDIDAVIAPLTAARDGLALVADLLPC